MCVLDSVVFVRFFAVHLFIVFWGLYDMSEFDELVYARDVAGPLLRAALACRRRWWVLRWDVCAVRLGGGVAGNLDSSVELWRA